MGGGDDGGENSETDRSCKMKDQKWTAQIRGGTQRGYSAELHKQRGRY